MSTKSTTMMPPMLRSRSWRATSSHASRLFADMDKEGNRDRKSTRLNSSHLGISYAVFCLKKKKNCLPSRARCRKTLATTTKCKITRSSCTTLWTDDVHYVTAGRLADPKEFQRPKFCERCQ